MKKIFFSILITFLLGLAVVIGVGLFRGSDYIAKSQSSVELNQTWKVALARYVNENGMVLSVDGNASVKTPAKEQGGPYMNDQMELMLDKASVRDLFGCAVNLYGGTDLTIARGNTNISVGMDAAETMDVNGQPVALSTSPYQNEQSIYIPAEVIANGIGYSYEWDTTTKTLTMNANDPEAPRLPRYYNYADIGRISAARDQGSLGTCWAFAALSALETTLLPEEDCNFSEDHMIYHNAFGSDVSAGGDYSMSLSYFSSWTGPVWEWDDPYGDDESPDGLTAVKHVQEVQMLESKDYDKIKKMIFCYGAVESSIYIALQGTNEIDLTYYNPYNDSYCFAGETYPNHEIIIIGWDDDYPAENFNVPVQNNGAFICRNSWGSDFGNDGIFYVSYEDPIIGTVNEVYTEVEAPDNYDHIYQYDDCGWTGRIGFDKNRAFFANVYTAQGEECLKAVSFYATGPNTAYRVYVVKNPTLTTSSTQKIKEAPLAQGVLANTGYYTVKLDETVDLSTGQEYAVIVEIDTPGTSHPIAIEMDGGEMRSVPVNLEGKYSYISSSGELWEQTQKTSNSNVCLKAFTVNR